MISREIRVKGRVQGVFFRKYTADKAIELGLRGFVRNEPNGDVYIEVEGAENEVELLTAWCEQGSPYSKVDQVEYSETEPQNFTKFEIRRL